MTDATEPDFRDAPADANDGAASADISSVDDRLIDLVAADAEVTPDDARTVMERRTELGATFYASLVASLVGLRKKEQDAERLWYELLKHKFTMSERLGRNVGIRVAALDYFINITGELDGSTQVVDRRMLVDTSILAITDGLTNLYNHRYFHDRLQTEIEKASGGDAPLSVIMLDIDHFKDYNDVNGHVAGDVTLHEVAAIVKREAEAADGVPARYGGEEFAVILPACGKARAGAVAEAIRAAVEAHPFPNEFVLQSRCLTISAGVAEFPLDATDRRGLVDYADRALYESKHDGRNRVNILAPNRRRRAGRLLHRGGGNRGGRLRLGRALPGRPGAPGGRGRAPAPAGSVGGRLQRAGGPHRPGPPREPRRLARRVPLHPAARIPAGSHPQLRGRRRIPPAGGGAARTMNRNRELYEILSRHQPHRTAAGSDSSAETVADPPSDAESTAPSASAPAAEVPPRVSDPAPQPQRPAPDAPPRKRKDGTDLVLGVDAALLIFLVVAVMMYTAYHLGRRSGEEDMMVRL
ncbi:MAG: diguanylate cyclase, partial [Planctomycetota bacterium]